MDWRSNAGEAKEIFKGRPQTGNRQFDCESEEESCQGSAGPCAQRAAEVLQYPQSGTQAN